MKKFIVIAGNIGAGKTTVSKLIGDIFGFEIYEERVQNNPYLEVFYKNMEKYAYPLQKFFLLSTALDHEIVSGSGKPCIQDRCVYEVAEVFTKNLHQQKIMSQEDYARFNLLYEEIIKDLKKPDLIIYLKADTQILRKRIANRGRDYEKNILDKDNSYLERLDSLYESWLSRYSGDVAVINTDDLNFVENPEDLKSIIMQIRLAIYGPSVISS